MLYFSFDMEYGYAAQPMRNCFTIHMPYFADRPRARRFALQIDAEIPDTIANCFNFVLLIL